MQHLCSNSLSDTPYGRDNLRRNIEKIRRLDGLTEADRDRILGGNLLETGECLSGNPVTGAAWLSSARVVRCWVKSRNERNPYL